MFHVHENKIYCPTHFEDLFLQRCHGCKQVIKGQYIKVMDHHFHQECWCCSVCKTTLKAETCALDNNEFFCRPCLSARRASKPAPAQVQQQMGSDPQAVPSASAAVAPAPSQSSAAADEKAAAALAAIKARQEAQNAAPAPSDASGASSASSYADPSVTKYSHEQLKGANRPADVDPSRREAYLSDADFQALFKTSRDDFNKLAEWKRKQQKQAQGLF
jgi:hypothetical protein